METTLVYLLAGIIVGAVTGAAGMSLFEALMVNALVLVILIFALPPGGF